MSMETHVLSDKRLPSIAAWQQAIDAEGFDLKLDPEVEFDTASGLLPAMLRGKQSGFESYHDDPRELMESYADVPYFKSCPAWKYALSFRWGADFKACLGAYMAAAAYAAATKGVVFDCEQGKVLTPQEAAQFARTMEKQLPELEAQLQEIMDKLARKP